MSEIIKLQKQNKALIKALRAIMRDREKMYPHSHKTLAPWCIADAAIYKNGGE